MDKELYTINQIKTMKLPQNYMSFNIIYKDHSFAASLAQDGELHIWNEIGTESIYDCSLNEIVELEQNIYDCLDANILGLSVCSICRKIMKQDEIALSFFAGRYCAECVTDDLIKEKEWAYSHLD